MPFLIERNDITRMKTDAIVNAANESLLGGGGVDGAIHRAAGPGLLKECRRLGGCGTGEAKATRAYRLPCRYVIHTVGPIWRGGSFGEEELLRSCYRNSLRIADELGAESVAFPLVSAGVYGYPKREALAVAADEIRRFLETHDMTVIMVIFDKSSFEISSELFGEVKEYVDENYCGEHEDACELSRRRYELAKQSLMGNYAAAKPAPRPPYELSASYDEAAKPAAHFSVPALHHAREDAVCEAEDAVCGAASGSLQEALGSLDEGFSENLMRRVIASGMTDAECYKRANIDRKLFSKIRNDKGYRPSKPTAVAFAVALRLDLENTADLLRRAGFALSRSSRFDVIIEYFIRNERWDVFEINEALFEFDQPLLGC